jgi:hypothetical protein
LGISQRFSYAVLAVPRGCTRTFKNISQRLLAKTEHFQIISSETVFLHLKKLKIEGAQENFYQLSAAPLQPQTYPTALL